MSKPRLGRIPKHIQPAPAVGQVWQDYNCTRDRQVEILRIFGSFASIRNTVTGRVTMARLDRFNGEAKGYKFYGIINPEWGDKHIEVE